MTEPFFPNPVRIINSNAPIRICDNGGWTDTWFAKHGNIFNIAVSPYAEVQIETFRRNETDFRVFIAAENFGDKYGYALNEFRFAESGAAREHMKPARHPLIEAAISYIGLPQDSSIRVTIYSEAPSGASTGTSAAVSVALITALFHMNGRTAHPDEIAAAAHHVEHRILGYQCGIQDQLCSAYGGINFIEMTEFPRARVTPVPVSPSVSHELERRLLLVYLGKSHISSEMHEKVILDLEQEGSECRKLKDLRTPAIASRDALLSGDFRALGMAMIENTEAQARLHSDLVNPDAQHIISIARRFGALGWKVNGAGGDGGSITILCGAKSTEKRLLIEAIEQENPGFRNIPIRLSPSGATVWENTDVSCNSAYSDI